MRTLLISAIVILLTFFSMPRALSETLTVAVIDTGISKNEPKLCKSGHKSFLGLFDNPLKDEHGHGTHIAGLINRNAKYEGDYCLVSLKYYSERASGEQNLKNMIAAIKYAIAIKVKFINISGGGPEPYDEERSLIKTALNNHIVVIAAAGNENDNLDLDCNYYPACYDSRVFVVGNWQIKYSPEYKREVKERNPSSSYGRRVNRWELGTNVLSSDKDEQGKEVKMTGTSQATAVATGKMIRENLSQY